MNEVNKYYKVFFILLFNSKIYIYISCQLFLDIKKIKLTYIYCSFNLICCIINLWRNVLKEKIYVQQR